MSNKRSLRCIGYIGPIDFWDGASIIEGERKDEVLSLMPEPPRDGDVFLTYLPNSEWSEMQELYMCKADNNGTVYLFAERNVIAEGLLHYEQLSLTLSLIEEVRKFAEKQLSEDNYEGVFFDYEGQSIVNPWVESTARIEMTTEEAFKFYGTDNMMFFIEEAVKVLHPEDMNFPDEGVFLVQIEGELGSHAQLWMHGLNDFAACFIEGDCSVRGSLEDIACEVDSFLIAQKKAYCKERLATMNEYAFNEIFDALKQILG